MRRPIAAIGVLVAVLVPSLAGADTLEPSQWPPELQTGSAVHALRIGGTDRYQTSFALALALRGRGDFPFDTADRTSAGAPTLAAASDWWGAASCPRSIIVVAGDTPADALAAASLSDPTDRSDEPRLERVAASDALFDPIGGFDRVDTEAAPIIVTISGRSGARGLAAAARLAAADLAGGGCTTAREAIIVGGTAAVPREAEAELVSLGYDEVFRVAGADRYETAARIATALGTEPAAAGGSCLDPDASDGTDLGFYGNAVIEYRPSITECELRGRSVVLAEGVTGADALAAGWWTSRWQVPVLLVAPDGSLPPPTRAALQTLEVETIVVLGGTGRIPESSVDEAKRLAGAVAGRFAGPDRYATSIQTAQVFGGWFATGDSEDFAGDLVCVVGSIGSGAAALGWADALAAGPWCGRAGGGGAAALRGPERALPLLELAGAAAVDVDAVEPAHDAVPIVLVPIGMDRLPEATQQFLGRAFAPDEPWCTAERTTSCSVPGFAVGIGGSATLSDAILQDTSRVVSGGNEARNDEAPELRDTFSTGLDLAPVFEDVGGYGDERLCVPGGGLVGIRWLAGYADAAASSFLTASDVAAAGVYRDGDAITRSSPVCVRVPRLQQVVLVGTSMSGHFRRSPTWLVGEVDRTTMSMSMVHGEADTASGDEPSSLEPGARTTFTWSDDAPPALELRARGESTRIASASARLVLVREEIDGSRGRFEGTLSLVGSNGATTAFTVEGSAIATESGWSLGGVARIEAASVGGMRATIDEGTTALTWRGDAARVGP